MRKNILTITSLLIVIFLFTGCATLFAPSNHSLAASSAPHGADVYVNGFRMGTTPI